MKTSKSARLLVFVFLIVLVSFPLEGESVRVLVAGVQKVSLTDPDGVTVPLTYVGSSLVHLEGDTRFFRGIQLELSVPQNYLNYRGSLAAVIYNELNHVPEAGIADLECSRVGFDPLPAKIQTIYQIPLKPDHGLRTTPYATVLTGVLSHSSFPVLFRLMPVIKGIGDELERMIFNLNVKPILSDEGALRINIRYPYNLPNKPLSVLIDDNLIENPREERLLKEGEHHLVILSEDYRNLSHLFVVERAKTLDLTVELQDTTPLVIFESPENARVYLDNVYIPNPRTPHPVVPGVHEVRFQVSDYTIIRPITVQKGKTYKVALAVDVTISETE